MLWKWKPEDQASSLIQQIKLQQLSVPGKTQRLRLPNYNAEFEANFEFHLSSVVLRLKCNMYCKRFM